MPNFVDVTYQQTGKSLDTDSFGMREMQRRAFAERNAQYLLLNQSILSVWSEKKLAIFKSIKNDKNIPQSTLF